MNKPILSFYKLKLFIQKFLNWIFPGYKLKYLFISSFHGIWMVIFSILWLININFLDGFGFMNDFMSLREFIGTVILNYQHKPRLEENYLLINTSNNNYLLPADNDNQINTVITDRMQLTRILNLLNDNSNKVKYIICDIFFSDCDTIHDYELQKVLDKLSKKRKIIIPFYIENEENYINYPVLKSFIGLSQYRTPFLNSHYLKFSYISFDTVKHIPLKVYENITNKRMVRHQMIKLNYYTIENKWCLNTIIPEFRFTRNNLVADSNLFDMGFFTSESIRNNPIVLIGDFNGYYDNHNTMIGEVAGPLIIINALESLLHGDNILQIPYILLLFLVFTIITYTTFYNKYIKLYLKNKNRRNIIIEFLRSHLNYILILILSLASMLFLHHYMNLFILLTYFGFIEISLSFLRLIKRITF